MLIKGSKDSYANLVSSEYMTEILLSYWMRQVTRDVVLKKEVWEQHSHTK